MSEENKGILICWIGAIIVISLIVGGIYALVVNNNAATTADVRSCLEAEGQWINYNCVVGRPPKP